MLFPSTDVEIVETEQRKGERERRPASAGERETVEETVDWTTHL